MNLKEIINAKSLNDYYAAKREPDFSEFLLTPAFSNSFSITSLTGYNNSAVQVLQQSELDADVEFRDFAIKSQTLGDKLFFREAIKLNEHQRKAILEALNTKNEKYIESYISRLYEELAGKKGFLASVQGIWKYQTGQLISTGKVTTVNESGTAKVIDYQIPDNMKEKLTGAATWDKATSNPLADLQRWKEALEDASGEAEIVVMNRATFLMFKNNAAVKKELDRLTNVFISDDVVKELIEKATGLKVYIWNEKVSYKDANGTTKKTVMPDNVVSILPNRAIGVMEFGPGPAKTDELQGVLGDRELVDIDGTFATLEVASEEKSAGVVRNVNIVIEACMAPSTDNLALFIATVK